MGRPKIRTKEYWEKYQKDYYKKNRESIALHNKNWIAKNLEAHKEYQKKYRELHKENTREYLKAYRTLKREELKKQNALYREMYPQRYRDYRKKWLDNNGDKEEFKHKRYCRTTAQYLFQEFQPCIYCGSNEKIHKHHPDYKQPKQIIFLCDKHHRQVHYLLGKKRVPMFKKGNDIINLLKNFNGY